MSKEEKIEDIKNVSEFYQALRNNVANTFNDYERCGIFDGWTENQKKECFHFGTHILSNVWLPIQKHYTNKERKKYEKIVNKYEDICKRQDQQIAELKHQLAESEKEHELLIDQFEEETEKLRKQIKQESDARKRFVEEVKNLKQQLTEKEKEIENLNNRILISQLQAPEEQRLKIIGSSCCQYNPNQDKISFAVEQLEQLKKLCQEKFNWWENSEWEGDIYDKSDVSNAYFDIEANVDNQIEELKKEMK